MFEENEETIRWPTDLDRAGIEKRLLYVGDLAANAGLADIASAFRDVAIMSAATIGNNVVTALTVIFNKPEHERLKYEEIARQLQMVAMNLKNL